MHTLRYLNHPQSMHAYAEMMRARDNTEFPFVLARMWSRIIAAISDHGILPVVSGRARWPLPLATSAAWSALSRHESRALAERMESKDPGVQKLAPTASAGLDEALSASLDNGRVDMTAQPPLRTPVSLRIPHDNAPRSLSNAVLSSRKGCVAPRSPRI